MSDRLSQTSTQGELHVWRTMLITWLFLAMISAAGVSLFYRHLNKNLHTGQSIDHVVQPSGPALNILVLGSDSRDGKGNDIDGLTDGGERSDTTILLHVSGNRKSAYGVSIPRDALVTRPDCRSDGKRIPGGDLQMFNAAFALGGPACVVRQVEKITGIPIEHYVVVDFRGFKDMVDAVNGVQVCIPKAIDDNVGNIHLAAGTHTLQGKAALDYVRERHDVGDGSDIGRMKRQQAFIASMTKKVVSSGTLTRIDRVVEFLNAATKSLTIDPGLDSVGKLIDLARQFRNTGLSHIKFISAPSTAYAPDPNRLVLTSDATKLWKRIKRDLPLGPAFNTGAISANDPSDGSKDGSKGGSTGGSKGGKKGGKKHHRHPTKAQQDAADQAGLCA